MEESRVGSPTGGARHAEAAGNLGHEATSFVGREEDVREVKGLVGRSRLVTLLGPGGIGKSRLAREVGSRTRSAFPGGVWVAELSHVDNPALIPATVARTLRVVQHGSAPLDQQIARAVAASTLLILDNCEHVVEAAARLASALLQASPALRILATSREPLEINGERVFLLHPLAVPAPGGTVTTADYARWPGLQLFVDRVQSRDHSFRPTAENLPLIGSICSRAGGMPLAIELAAGRAARTNLEAIDQDMGEQLGFQSHHRDVPERHRTMRAALEWSYELLTESERELWRRLAMFPGGATAAALQAGSDTPTASEDPLEAALLNLFEKSIVILDRESRQLRYRLLEPLRLFGLEQARLRGEETALRRAQLEWCATVIPADAWAEGADQLHWMQTFEREHANICAALDFCLADESSFARGAELFAATFIFWGLRGWYSEERHYAEAMLSRAPKRAVLRGVLLFVAGLSAWYTGEVEIASTRFREAARSRRGSRSRALGTHGLGLCALMDDDYDRDRAA